MDVTSLTVALPVSDLERSSAWFSRVLQVGRTPLLPVAGVLELEVAPGCWVQLFHAEEVGTSDGVVLRLGVADVAAERQRLLGLGVEVADLVRVAGAFDYADFRDPDGHLLTIYTML